MRRLMIVVLVMALFVLLAAGPAFADAGDEYFSRITCSGQYDGVYIYSHAENWVDYWWDAPGHTYKWNPYGDYWGYNTADPSTWVVIEWDHAKDGSSGRYCRSVLY